jgi:DNA adenine methylase
MLRGGAFDISRVVPHLEELHSRLAGVTIECLPYSEFIARYDRPSKLFYLDPPYLGMEKLYEGGFTREDFGRLAAQLSSIQGRFIMSLNDSAEVRRLFAKFRLATVETRYTAGGPSHVKRSRSC